MEFNLFVFWQILCHHIWPVWLNVMLACCVDSNLKKKKKLCQLCQLTFQRCASLFFLFVCVYACADTLRVHVCVCVFFFPVYVVRMKKNKIKKKLGGVHGIQSVSVLANIVPSVWPVWLNVMLACCVDLHLHRTNKERHVQKLKMYVDARMSARFLCLCICMRCFF